MLPRLPHNSLEDLSPDLLRYRIVGAWQMHGGGFPQVSMARQDLGRGTSGIGFCCGPCIFSATRSNQHNATAFSFIMQMCRFSRELPSTCRLQSSEKDSRPASYASLNRLAVPDLGR